MNQKQRDLCKGVRLCYDGILKAIVINPVVGALCMGIPTYFLISGIFYQRALLEYSQFNISGPFYTILAFTALAWIIEMISIRWVYPNLLAVCAFCHSAVGSWWLVNLFIIMTSGWSYIPIRYMGAILLATSTPALIWIFTGDIIRAYKRKLLDEISNQTRALATKDELITNRDIEIGMGK